MKMWPVTVTQTRLTGSNLFFSFSMILSILLSVLIDTFLKRRSGYVG